MAVWIILPTYNEAETILGVIAALRSQLEAEILVVDDHSPDGTGALIDSERRHDQHLHSIHRPGKMGLGSAYQDGFRYALDHGANVIVQMDADGSHDPQLVPSMIAALEHHDLVLASRYVAGGSFPIVWYRRWISTLGNTYIRALLGWQVRDWSTGFKVWRADFLRLVMDRPMHGVGYAWLMEMTWLAKKLEGRVTEVPLVFLERQGGQSKFSWRIAAEDISLAWRLWRR